MANPTAARPKPKSFTPDAAAVANALCAAAELERMAAEHLAAVVAVARILGASWEDIGEAIGTSRQAASARFNK